jgi:acyl carrier protein
MMTNEQIFTKIQSILADALARDEDEVQMKSRLTLDLKAESIDFLDIVFKLEQAFGIKIGEGELFPQNVLGDPKFVKDGKVTADGIATMKAKLPHFDLGILEKDASLTNVPEILTVESLVRFVSNKLAAKGG